MTREEDGALPQRHLGSTAVAARPAIVGLLPVLLAFATGAAAATCVGRSLGAGGHLEAGRPRAGTDDPHGQRAGLRDLVVEESVEASPAGISRRCPASCCAEQRAEFDKLRQDFLELEAVVKQLSTELQERGHSAADRKQLMATLRASAKAAADGYGSRVAELRPGAERGDRSSDPKTSSALPRRAYVTMAHGASHYLWSVIALARSLQQLGSYPLVLLTNITHMPDGVTPVAAALRHLNVHVLPLQEVKLPENTTVPFASWIVAYWKLQVFNLTQFDRLVWMDSDSMVVRSLDWMFGEPWMVAQTNQWDGCSNQTEMCSGLVLVFPNQDDFVKLQAHAASRPYWGNGDQAVIQSYFENVAQRPIKLLAQTDAAFGWCLGRASTPFVNSEGDVVEGIWNTPAFIHKSGGWGYYVGTYWNVCFSHNVTMQYYVRDGAVINVCHYNPLGPLWREIFCEAIAMIAVENPETVAFCDDGCWYRGAPSGAVSAALVDKARWCRPVESALHRPLDHPGQPLFM